MQETLNETLPKLIGDVIQGTENYTSWTLPMFADLVGVNPRTVRRWRSGAARPSAFHLGLLLACASLSAHERSQVWDRWIQSGRFAALRVLLNFSEGKTC